MGMEHLVKEAKEYAYDESFVFEPRILVVGCGGAGGNSVNRLHRMGVHGAETVAINTDKAHLDRIEADRKILIGRSITKGLGTGGKPEIGRRCAELSEDELREVLHRSDLTFITVGMGGGTGTGTAPFVAELAKRTGSIVVAIASTPFSVEKSRRVRAGRGLEELRRFADSVIVLDNDRLLEIVPDLPMEQAFSVMDQLISEMIKGVTETITLPSLINLDFADVKTIMSSGGTSTMLYGENCADDPDQVVAEALNNPLLDVDYDGATGALVHITSGPSMSLRTAYQVVEGITKELDENANVIIGARVDSDYEGVIKLMAIMTGVHSPNLLSPHQGLVKVMDEDEIGIGIPIVR